MLTPTFAGELFGPGQPLDASKYYIIIPDSIGHGKSSKPSDGMKTAFPKYNYEDMVDAQYRLVKEGLGVKHLRLVIGNSMGGMHTWIWGVKYPQAMDVLVPMASAADRDGGAQLDAAPDDAGDIRNDPDYNGGNYTSQPRMMKIRHQRLRHRDRRGTLAYQVAGPDGGESRQDGRRPAGGRHHRRRQRFRLPVESSHDYNPRGMEKIEATLLLINAADDERNPPETGVTDAAMKRIRTASCI